MSFYTLITLGYYEGTVYWESSPEPSVNEMRIYQVSNTGENIAGYAAFPYSARSGTFIILDGCIKIYGKAYTTSGESSAASNMLDVSCLCEECEQPPYEGGTNPPVPPPEDGRISAISSQSLTFSAEKGKYYLVECCTDLNQGNWEFLTIISTEFSGDVNYSIDTSEHDTCYYRVIPL